MDGAFRRSTAISLTETRAMLFFSAIPPPSLEYFVRDYLKADRMRFHAHPLRILVPIPVAAKGRGMCEGKVNVYLKTAAWNAARHPNFISDRFQLISAPDSRATAR